MTNYRKIMNDVLEGKAAEFLPFAPRLEIWYKCNKLRGTLPDKYKNAGMFDIIDDLDIGLNYMVPDYAQHGGTENTYSTGLGHLFSHVATAHNLSFENIDMEASIDGYLTTCLFKTPYGNLQTKVLYDDNMIRSGITIPAKKEHLIKSADDYKAAKYLFENIAVAPVYDIYDDYIEKIGDRTIRNAMVTFRVSGYHLLMMDLMEYQDFIYNQSDYPEETEELCRVIDEYTRKCVEISVGSKADLITVGAHFDHMLTGRPLFQERFVPVIKDYSKYLTSMGKKLACHTDSDNDGLMDLYVESGVQVCDSICTAPLTQQTYRDIRRETRGEITLFGVIPSISVLKNSMTDYDFEKYLDTLLTEIQSDGGRNVILAIADTTPPDADFERVKRIARLSRQVKPR